MKTKRKELSRENLQKIILKMAGLYFSFHSFRKIHIEDMFYASRAQ